jgi:hypothetical protein
LCTNRPSALLLIMSMSEQVVTSAGGAERGIKNARALFLRLKQGDRRAALAMLDG